MSVCCCELFLDIQSRNIGLYFVDFNVAKRVSGTMDCLQAITRHKGSPCAFSAGVRVWEIVYSNDGSVKEVLNVMQLKGRKSAWQPSCVPFSKPTTALNVNDEDDSFKCFFQEKV